MTARSACAAAERVTANTDGRRGRGRGDHFSTVFSQARAVGVNLRGDLPGINIDRNVEQVYNTYLSLRLNGRDSEGVGTPTEPLTDTSEQDSPMNAFEYSITPPATHTTEYDPPLPDTDLIPASASFVTMRRPNGVIVCILDIEDYVAFMEHIGYQRVASESEVR